MLKSVVLPEPEGPMMERYSPRAISRSTPFRAWTSILPSLNDLVTLMTRTTWLTSGMRYSSVTTQVFRLKAEGQ